MSFQANTKIPFIGTLKNDDVTITDYTNVSISALVQNMNGGYKLFFTNVEGLENDGTISINNGAFAFVMTEAQSKLMAGDCYVEIAIDFADEAGKKIGTTKKTQKFTIEDNKIGGLC